MEKRLQRSVAFKGSRDQKLFNTVTNTGKGENKREVSSLGSGTPSPVEIAHNQHTLKSAPSQPWHWLLSDSTQTTKIQRIMSSCSKQSQSGEILGSAVTSGTAKAARGAREELTGCHGSHEEAFTAKSHHITEEKPGSTVALWYWEMDSIYQQATNELNTFLLN